MADDNCLTCKGTGAVRDLQKPDPGKLMETPSAKCHDCDGTGKRQKR
jgi:DnaJ-class molecular chaperone